MTFNKHEKKTQQQNCYEQHIPPENEKLNAEPDTISRTQRFDTKNRIAKKPECFSIVNQSHLGNRQNSRVTKYAVALFLDVLFGRTNAAPPELHLSLDDGHA